MVGPTSSLFKVGIQRVDLHHAVCNFWDDDPGVFITYVDLAEPVTAKQLREFRAFEAEVDAMHDADKPIPGDGPSLFVEIVGQPDKGEDAKGRLIGYGFTPQSLPFTASDMTGEFFLSFGSRPDQGEPRKVTFELGVIPGPPVSTNYDFGRLESLIPQTGLIIYGKVNKASATSVNFEILKTLRGDPSNLKLNAVASQKRTGANLNGCISDMHWPVGKTCCLFIRNNALVNYGNGIQQMPYYGEVDVDELTKIVNTWDKHFKGQDINELRKNLGKMTKEQRLVMQIVDDQPVLESIEPWKERVAELMKIK